ncbi:hypothetical protein APHAL10511_005930 [Amanita phalloides]|nr:hypothetical protein APHAL10511_005930 [Amanita phalloides]
MTTETSQVKSKLAILASSVDDLEELLEPLFAQSLPETIMSLEPMQQAKLQTVLPYLVYDLLFIYLKARGVDPKSHPVIQELDRVKNYFRKIANAENSGNKEPVTKLDKAAAGRFIKNAISQAARQPTQIEASPAAIASSSIPIKVTSKMLARAQYELHLKQQDDRNTDEEGLEVIDEEDPDKIGTTGNDVDNDEPPRKTGRDADKIETQVGKKRRRPLVDPFTGYGDDSSTTDRGAQSQSESYSVPKPLDASYPNSLSSIPLSIDATSSSHRSPVNPQNRKKKKAKHQAV